MAFAAGLLGGVPMGELEDDEEDEEDEMQGPMPPANSSSRRAAGARAKSTGAPSTMGLMTFRPRRPLWMPTWSTTAAACLLGATWRGMRFRFGGGLVNGAARRTRGTDEAPHTIEQLQGDFAGLPLM